MLPLLLFLFLSIILVVFSSKVSLPFDFVAHTFSPIRAFLYGSAHAETKPTELDLLKQENIELRAKLAILNELKKDNVALRNQFEDTTISPRLLLPAKIIGFSGPFDSPTELLIDQGKNSGIKKGMAVVSGHVLVGKIGKVTAWNSQLILVASKNFSTLGITSQGNSTGVVSGEDDFILFKNVVITDNLTKGETVVAKGDVDKNGMGIPPDLIIGKVISINKSDSSPFQNAFIKPLINFGKLTTVFIVKQ